MLCDLQPSAVYSSTVWVVSGSCGGLAAWDRHSVGQDARSAGALLSGMVVIADQSGDARTARGSAARSNARLPGGSSGLRILLNHRNNQ